MKDRLKELRKKLKLNQAEFAAKLEMAQNSYSQVETGLISLTEKNIKLVCLIFGVNEAWLRNGKGQMFITKDLADTPEEKELLTIFRRLPEEMKDFFLEMGRKLLAKDEVRRVKKQEDEAHYAEKGEQSG